MTMASPEGVVIQMSYPSDEVGNALLSWDQLDEKQVDPYRDSFEYDQFRAVFGPHTVHPFTGVDYIEYYRSFAPNTKIVFSNDPSFILNYTKKVITCDIHTRMRTKRILRQKRAQALGMKVLAYDIFKAEGLENENMKYVEMDELLANSDFISVHTPSIDGKPLINADTIAKMKDGAIVINTSRGNNVDEDALLAALESGKLRGAGLDVFAEEPAKNHALYSHPHVSCTPHIGAQTAEAQKRVGAEIVDIIKNFA